MEIQASNDLALVAVRTAIARHFGMRVRDIEPDDRLFADLGIDLIDLAFIAVALEDLTGAREVIVPTLDPMATVRGLADRLRPTLARAPYFGAMPVLRAAGGDR